MSSEELVDVVDRNDRVVRSVTRAMMREEFLSHRVVYVFVLSTSGDRLLVHQRSSAKDVWPSRWDLAFGGVVGSGEEYDTAAKRELAEEAGIVGEMFALGRTTWNAPPEWGEGNFVKGSVYSVNSDGPFTFTDGEVARVEWVLLDELAEVIASRIWCDDTVHSALPLLLAAEAEQIRSIKTGVAVPGADLRAAKRLGINVSELAREALSDRLRDEMPDQQIAGYRAAYAEWEDLAWDHLASDGLEPT